MSVQMRDCISPTFPCSSEEEIGVVALRPRHWRGEAFDPASMFPTTQLEEQGLSGVRLAWSTPQEMLKEIVLSARLTKEGTRQAPISVIVGRVSVFRSITYNDGTQAIDVWASGTPNLRGHVDIGIVVAANLNIPNSSAAQKTSKSTIRMVRAKLIDALFGNEAITVPGFWPRLGVCCSGIKSSLVSHPVPSLFFSI